MKHRANETISLVRVNPTLGELSRVNPSSRLLGLKNDKISFSASSKPSCVASERRKGQALNCPALRHTHTHTSNEGQTKLPFLLNENDELFSQLPSSFPPSLLHCSSLNGFVKEPKTFKFQFACFVGLYSHGSTLLHSIL